MLQDGTEQFSVKFTKDVKKPGKYLLLKEDNIKTGDGRKLKVLVEEFLETKNVLVDAE